MAKFNRWGCFNIKRFHYSLLEWVKICTCR